MKPRFTRHAAMTLVLALLAGATLLLADDDPPQYGDWSAPVNLGATVNTAALEQGPTISKDGLTLYFQSNRAGGFGADDIWFVTRTSVDQPWSAPVNAGPGVNTAANESAPQLSQDGHRLYFHSNRAGGWGGADIYVSRRHNKRDNFGWQMPQNLGGLVNTAAQEQQPFVIEDEASGVISLYFASDRPGGMGGLDLYASVLQPDETFGWPGPVVELNSAANDRGLAIRRDGLEAVFPSNRPGPIPGNHDDLWVSTRLSPSGTWSTPVHLGTTVNGPLSDAQPAFSFDGTALYFNTGGGFGAFDLVVVTRSKLQGPQ